MSKDTTSEKKCSCVNLAENLFDFKQAVINKDLMTVLCSLYVDINYAKDIMSINSFKSSTKINYVLKELDEAIKAINLMES